MTDFIQTKQCNKCKQIKPFSEFYKNQTGKNGLRSFCKSCHIASQQTEKSKLTKKAYRESEKGKKIQHYYNVSAKHKESSKNYFQSEKGKEKHRQNARIYYNRYPEKIKAHNIINNAIATGKLPRPDTLQCSCGKQAKHYHHPNYAIKLDVIAVCIQCHQKLHNILSSLRKSG